MSFGLDDAHLAVSNQVVESMPPRRRGDVEVVVHGVPLAQLRAERRHRTKARIALGLHSDEIAIGTIANFRSDKAYPVLLRAAADVLASHGNVRFFSIGQGPLEAETRALRDRLGLGHRFELLGAREDATQLLSAFDIFVLASTREGLPVALMESLALSLPVVATAVGGTPSAIRDGVEGFLVPPNDPQRIAAALERLIDDAELRTRMSRASGERAELFDIVPAVRRTESIYRMLADSRRSRCRDARQ
jgi:glycosyltransferase involved in cell wall biosynthesis